MEFEFADHNLEAVFYDRKASLDHGPAVDKGFRKVMGFIASAHDEQDLRRMKGLHYHKLKGDRSNHYGINITDQWRLIVERREVKEGISLLILAVEDYH